LTALHRPADDAAGVEVDHDRRHIAHITGPESFQVVSDRAGAYGEVLSEAGLDVPADWLLRGEWSELWGHAAIDRLWSAPGPKPDGIFCGNDQIARGVIDALRERGVGVPGDVSVVGFDNWEIVAAQTRPPLTTVDMNLRELGRQAGLQLMRQINGEAFEPGLTRLPCGLIVRQSS
jgi:LacI family transcriptional regulator